jgi:hypothetical protein
VYKPIGCSSSPKQLSLEDNCKSWILVLKLRSALPRLRGYLYGDYTSDRSVVGYLTMGLLNYVGDINLGINNFTEFPSVVTL